MTPLFAKKCPSCGFENYHDARFCSSCGNPLAGSAGKVCGYCQTDNKQDAVFCKNCGRALSATEETEIHGNHWARREGDFAARVEVNDLPGILSKKLEVEPGTQALVYANGTPQEILPPGVYTMDSIGKTISNWLTGVPNSATVLLVDVSPTEMVIRNENRYTSDPLPISMAIRLVVEVTDAAKFLLAALRGRERYSLDDLRNYIEPEVLTVTDNYLSHHTLEQLVENPKTRRELELAVEESLRSTFEQYGLKLRSLRTAELDLQVYDKIKGTKGNYSLLVQEGEVELSGKQRLLDLNNRVDLLALAEETAKVENEERKIDLYQRMRQVVQTDKINEVRSEVDFNKFLDEIDQQKLLSEKERRDLLKGWEQEAEDRDRARAFLLAKTDAEEKYQLEVMDIKLRGEKELEKENFELQLARLRADKELEIEEQKWQAQLKNKRALQELEQTIFEQDVHEAEEGIRLLGALKREKMTLAHEDEEHALEIRLKEARENVDIEIKRLSAEHQRELERLEKLAVLGTEALIAASPAEQGRILHDLKHAEVLKGMSEDQILAMAAEKSPELGKVFEEKYRAIAEGKAEQRERELYEKLLAENQSSQRLLIETQSAAMERLQRMSEHNVDAMKEMSVAYAQQKTSPVIISGSSGGSVIHGGALGETASREEVKICPTCGRQVAVNSRYCQYCNNEFKDIK